LESSKQIDDITIVVLGSLGMLTLVSFIILFVVFYQKRMLEHMSQLNENETKHQKKLLEASMEVAEQERKKIAGNIHDDIGIILSVIKLNLSRIKRNKNDAALVDELLQTNDSLLEDTIATVRSISHDLMPQALVRLGFIKGIAELCHQVSSAGVQKISLVKNTDEVTGLDKKTEMQLYRLTKEILNNIIKHAVATEIELNVSLLNNTLCTTISHNGKGITDNKVKELINAGRGIGLQSIYSRGQLTNSQINYLLINDHYQVKIETPIL
jgi:signal transduction histidine kinase